MSGHIETPPLKSVTQEALYVVYKIPLLARALGQARARQQGILYQYTTSSITTVLLICNITVAILVSSENTRAINL